MLPRLPTPTLLLLACAILLTTDRTNALDVEVVETTCDESLPVTAQLYLNCAAGSRCTFGNTTLVTGSGMSLSSTDFPPHVVCEILSCDVRIATTVSNAMHHFSRPQ